MPGNDMSILVAGLGSECGADVLGWEVVRALQGQDLPEAVCLLQCGHPAEMLEPLLRADAAIIVDACVGEGEAGRLREVCLGDIEPGIRQVHGLGLAEVLRLAIVLGLRADRLWIYGLMVPSCEVELEQAWVSRAVPELVQIVRGKSLEVCPPAASAVAGSL